MGYATIYNNMEVEDSCVSREVEGIFSTQVLS